MSLALYPQVLECSKRASIFWPYQSENTKFADFEREVVHHSTDEGDGNKWERGGLAKGKA